MPTTSLQATYLRIPGFPLDQGSVDIGGLFSLYGSPPAPLPPPAAATLSCWSLDTITDSNGVHALKIVIDNNGARTAGDNGPPPPTINPKPSAAAVLSFISAVEVEDLPKPNSARMDGFLFYAKLHAPIDIPTVVSEVSIWAGPQRQPLWFHVYLVEDPAHEHPLDGFTIAIPTVPASLRPSGGRPVIKPLANAARPTGTAKKASKSATKESRVKKPGAKKASTKKSLVKKSPAKKSPPKKSVAKKSPAKKSPPKKSAKSVRK